MASITVNNDFIALSKALNQPPVVKVDSNNSYVESIQEDFDMNFVRSRKLSTLDPDSFRYEGGQTSDRIWLAVPERSFDLAYELSKNINPSESDILNGSMVVVQADSPELKEKRENFQLKRAVNDCSSSDFEIKTEILRQAVEQQKKFLVNSRFGDDDLNSQSQFQKTTQIRTYNEEKYLTDLSRKLRKVYNHVLVVDEKYDEVEEGRTSKENKNQGKFRSETLDLRKRITHSSYPEDHRLYQEYCNFHKTNTDEMFNHEEMKNEMIEGMKVFFFY